MLLPALLLSGLMLAPGPPRPTPTPAPPAVALKVRSRKERMDRYLLASMRRAGVDSWLVLTREGARDPISEDVAADHVVLRAACLFVDRGEKLDRVAIVASFDTEPFEKSGLYTRVIAYGKEGAAPALKKEIETYNPKTIAVDTSRDVELADGLSSGNLQWLRETLGPELSRRLVSADAMLISFRSRKTPAEVEKMRGAVKKTERILAEALSPAVITPGKTTEKDVAEFIRTRRREMGLSASWEEDQDPNVMAGLARGHSAARPRSSTSQF